MYRVMLVDDDQAIRLRLRSNVDWTSLGIGEIIEAGDGIEALELFEEHRPQIILLDINLPHINGLTVAQEILAKETDVIIIMITGYNEFEYAQRAIQIGVHELLAKPLDMDEVQHILGAACTRIATERSNQQERLRMLGMMQDNLNVLQQNFVRNLLDGQVKGETAKLLRQLSLDLSGNFFCVSEIIANMNNVPPTDIELMALIIGNIASELLTENGFKNFILYDNSQNLTILLSFNTAEEEQYIDRVFMSVRNKYKFYFGYDLVVGIGSVVKSLRELPFSRKDAKEALNYHVIFGQNNTVNIKNVVKFVGRTATHPSAEINEIINCFKAGELKTMRLHLDNVIDELLVSSDNALAAVRRVIIELTVLLLQIAAENGVDEELFLETPDPYSQIMSIELIPDLKRWFYELYGRLNGCIAERQQNRISRVILSATEFIEANFDNSNLGLDDISEHVGLSAVYFSKLFHKHTGTGISQYVNDRRIEKAKALLRSTNMRIFEVAEAVGFNNPRYFNYVFKKTLGMSPNVWRTMRD
ncbi:MAG: response regulator [Clostridiaceae bacterium]|nr:response regulator [Clostridiaceae bacterium]